MNHAAAPARTFLLFVLVLLCAMLLAAIASPWVQTWLVPIAEVPLHRVFSRLTMLGVIAGTAWLLIQQHLARRELLGFTGPWPQFMWRLLLGIVAGIALMALAVTPLLLLGVRDLRQQLPNESILLLMLILKGLGTGLVVALLEETFFRGAMQGALQHQGDRLWTLLAVPLLYSAVHFLGRPMDVPDNQVDAWSGFAVWQSFFASFARPLRILDAFVALYFVGMVLALVRQRWGNLAACIGLHAGFITVIAVFRKISVPAPDSDWSFLAGAFDGLLGIWIGAIAALLCLILWRTSRAIRAVPTLRPPPSR